MVPLGSLVAVQQGYGPDQVMHYNGFPAAEINGGPAPGFSSGQAQAAIARVLRAAAERHGFEWTELAYQEICRQHDAPRVPAVRAARLRGAGGAVRELDAAAERHPDRADDAAVRDRRRLADGR